MNELIREIHLAIPKIYKTLDKLFGSVPIRPNIVLGEECYKDSEFNQDSSSYFEKCQLVHISLKDLISRYETKSKIGLSIKESVEGYIVGLCAYHWYSALHDFNYENARQRLYVKSKEFSSTMSFSDLMSPSNLMLSNMMLIARPHSLSHWATKYYFQNNYGKKNKWAEVWDKVLINHLPELSAEFPGSLAPYVFSPFYSFRDEEEFQKIARASLEKLTEEEHLFLKNLRSMIELHLKKTQTG